jgi:hypothetical protein
MSRDIIENVKAPRALHVRFPYGAPLGPAGAMTTQLAVVRAALQVLVTADAPGLVVEADIDWPE